MQKIDELIKQFLQELGYEPILNMLSNVKSGKKLRSKLLLAIADESEIAFKICAAIELIHLASLLHDDIIDESELRRGARSVNAEFGTKNALMLGDILYSKAFYELSKMDARFASIISDAVVKLAIGELMDVDLGEKFNINKEAYLKMIYNKTADFTKDKEGKNICSACINHKNKENIDYKARFKELEVLCDKYRRMNGKFEYDCAIAVSGGKDSHFQVHIMKEKLGMNPILFSVEDNFTMTEAGKKKS